MATTASNSGVNSAPTLAAPVSVRHTEDAGRIGVNLLEGARDAEGNALSVTGLKLTGGSASGYSVKDGVLSLDTAQFNKLKNGESRTVTFTYLVSDGKLKTPQTLTLEIVGVNDAPVVKAALKASTTEDSAPLTVNLLSGATDVDGDALSVASFTQTAGPQAAFQIIDGQLVLDPTQFNYLKYGQSAVLTFTYMVSDGIAQVPQSVTVTVAGRNDAPVIEGAIVARTDEDAGTFTLNLLAGATDVDGDSLSVSGLKLASGQSVKFTQKNGVLSLDSNQFKSLAAGQSQDLVFTYLVSDGKGGTVAQSATVTVEGRNDAPVMAAAAVMPTIAEDGISAGVTVASLFAVKAIDTDAGSAFSGIAVVGNAVGADQGQWQYSSDDGATWSAIGPASDSAAVLLSASTLVRFAAAANYFGTPQPLSVRAVDDSHAGGWSNGDAVVVANTTTNGGATAFSSGLSSLKISVNAVNDAPVVSLSGAKLGSFLGASETLVATHTAGEQEGNKVVALADGGFLVVWHSFDPKSGDGQGDIAAQRYDVQGVKVGAEYLLNAASIGTQHSASLVTLSNGTLMAVWQNSAPGQPAVISGRILNAVGTPVTPEFVVQRDGVGYGGSSYGAPSVAALAGGRSVVTWVSANDGSGSGIRARFMNADGTWAGSDFQVNSKIGGNQVVPRVVSLADGGFAICWQDGSSPADIRMQRFAAAGGKVGGEIMVPTSTVGFESDPAITVLTDGGMMVVWSGGAVTGQRAQGIYGQRFDADGNPVGGEVMIANQADPRSPSIISLADGGCLVAWTFQGQSYGDQSGGGVAAQRFDAMGNTIGTPFLVNQQSDGVQANQGMAVLEDGRVVVAWNSRDPDWGDAQSGNNVMRIFTPPPLFVEDQAAVKVLADVSVSDVDSALLRRATVTITNMAAGDVLSFTPTAGITGSYNSKTGVLTLNGSASPSLFQSVLRSVTFANTSNTPVTDNRVLTLTVSDGTATSTALETMVQVAATNDAPIIGVSGVASGLKENAAGLTLAKVTATDPEGDSVTFSTDDPRFEVVGGLLRLKAGMSLDYEAAPNGGSVTVTATDAHGASTSTVVGYKVVNVDEPLKAADDNVAIVEDQAVTIAILANDLHASNVRLPTITTASVSHGSVTINADGTLTYVPGANRNEPVVISYTLAEDGKVSSAKVNVSITAQADAPAISFTGAGGSTYAPILLSVTAALVDLDGSETLSDITISGLPAEARLSAGIRNGNGDWVLTQAQLAGLSVITTKGGAWSLTVSATATETGNGDSRTTTVAGALNVQAVPTINADWLYGKENYSDVIYGLPGNDFIDGLSGNDNLYGEAGDDYLRGGAGNDRLSGDAGNDTLEGGSGNDTISDYAGRNTYLGGEGDDWIYSSISDGFVDGGDGNDKIYGFLGNTTVYGGLGRDTFQLTSHGANGLGMRIKDFECGPAGDILDLSEYRSNMERGGWDGRSNPFVSGFIRLVEVAGGVNVQVKELSYSTSVWVTVAILENVRAASLTGDNFGDLYNFSPDGRLPTGLDVVRTSSSMSSLWGSAGDDVLENKSAGTSLFGGAGNDIIRAGQYGDSLCGGTGSDTLYGGAGNDYLLGDEDLTGSGVRDTLYGGAGNDLIYTGTGGDVVYGEDGNDKIYAMTWDSQSNTIDCGNGDDIVGFQKSGNNTITLGAGRDTLELSSSQLSSYAGVSTITDFVTGKGGDQINLNYLLPYLTGWNNTTNPFATSYLRLRQQGADTVLEVDKDGAAANASYRPILILKNVTPTSLTSDNFVQAYDPAGSTPNGVTLTGGSLPDNLIGGGGNDTLIGGVGDDTLIGANGNDVLMGGDGADSIWGDLGNDWMEGGAGNDNLAGDQGDDWLFGGDGNDTIQTGLGYDYVFAGNGNDTVFLGGDATADIDLGAGDDTLHLSNGQCTLKTGAGRDTLKYFYSPSQNFTTVTDFTPGANGDVIDLNGFQQNNLKGWNGQDNPFGSGYLRVVQSGGDTLLQVDTDGFGGTAQWTTLVVLAGVQASSLTEANFYPAYHPDGSGVYGASLTGGSGNDSFAGTVGDDILNGGGGADVINGAAGRDVLSGGDGADTLTGGSGRDTLIGGTGNDTLSGGAGEDLYLFNRGDGADTIVNAAANLDNAADTLRFGAGIDGDDLWFARSGANLEVSVLGSVDKVVLAEWYSSTVGAKVQSLQLADGSTLDQSRVENLVSAMAAFNPPPATQTQLTTQQHQALDTVIAAAWQHS
jgi:VCBS repeat-containing protein